MTVTLTTPGQPFSTPAGEVITVANMFVRFDAGKFVFLVADVIIIPGRIIEKRGVVWHKKHLMIEDG